MGNGVQGGPGSKRVCAGRSPPILPGDVLHEGGGREGVPGQIVLQTGGVGRCRGTSHL